MTRGAGALAGVGLALWAGAAGAAFPCDEFWAERNAVYFEAGYCFRTARAIEAFGRNEGCRFEDIADVPLSARDRRKVAEIVAAERRHGCPR